MVFVAVALNAGLEPGSSAGTHVDGREFVVWKDNAGAAHVWDDRCPHRGMKMSFGFVRGDHIACLYHGWQYDTGGRCRYIPAHPDLAPPDTIRIATYPVAVRTGMIWANVSGEAAEPLADEPATPVRTVYADVAPDRAGAALAEAGARVVNGLWRLTVDGLAMAVAVQPLAPARSALHLVVLAEDVAAPALHAAATFGEALRRTLEAGSAA